MAYSISVAAGTRETIRSIWKCGNVEMWKCADTLGAARKSTTTSKTVQAGDKEIRSS
jgi:hypothetical protein